MTEKGRTVFETDVWLHGQEATDRTKARVWLSSWPADLKLGEVLSFELVDRGVYTGSEVCGFNLVVPSEMTGPGRKLRRLATYRRDQQRIPAEMDVQDELRAMEVLAKTLDSLNLPTRERVLHWLDHRKCMQVTAHTLGREPLPTLVSVSESLRIAKDRVLGQEPPA